MAWRNIWRNKARSIVIIISISIGLFAGLLVLGLYKGMLKDRLRMVIETEVSHVQIHHTKFKEDYDPSFILPEGNRMLSEIEKSGFVKHVTQRSVTQGMLATTTGTDGVEILGIIPEKEDLISGLNKKIKEGGGFGTKKNEVLVGKKLADKMNLKPGGKLVLTFTDNESNITSGAFRVSGIYQSDNTPRDERIVYVKLDDLNAMLNTGNDFHEIAVILRDDELLERVKEEWSRAYPQYKVETWKELSPETELIISMTDQYSQIFIIIIMLALAFGVINTMLMAVLERTREIGMLVALGMNRLKLFILVLMETILLTLAGVPLGMLVSWLMINSLSKTGIDISSFAGEAMSSFGFGSIIYPEFPGEKIIGVMIIVITTAFVSSLFPSIKAIKLQPADAMRR